MHGLPAEGIQVDAQCGSCFVVEGSNGQGRVVCFEEEASRLTGSEGSRIVAETEAYVEAAVEELGEELGASSEAVYYPWLGGAAMQAQEVVPCPYAVNNHRSA